MATRDCNEIDFHVGQQLRRFRTERNISLERLGEKLGMSHQQIQRYEAGGNRIASSTLWSLSKALNVPVERFYEGLPKGLTVKGTSSPQA